MTGVLIYLAGALVTTLALSVFFGLASSKILLRLDLDEEDDQLWFNLLCTTFWPLAWPAFVLSCVFLLLVRAIRGER